MRLRILSIAAAVLSCGCAYVTNGTRQMAPGKLAAIKAGETTRQEMIDWFGAPNYQTFDTSGKLAMNWLYVRVVSVPTGTLRQTQSIAALFDTNNVVEKVSFVDGINPPPGAPPVKPLKTVKGQ
jgi:hypothetical protein